MKVGPKLISSILIIFTVLLTPNTQASVNCDSKSRVWQVIEALIKPKLTEKPVINKPPNPVKMDAELSKKIADNIISRLPIITKLQKNKVIEGLIRPNDVFHLDDTTVSLLEESLNKRDLHAFDLLSSHIFFEHPSSQKLISVHQWFGKVGVTELKKNKGGIRKWYSERLELSGVAETSKKPTQLLDEGENNMNLLYTAFANQKSFERNQIIIPIDIDDIESLKSNGYFDLTFPFYEASSAWKALDDSAFYSSKNHFTKKLSDLWTSDSQWTQSERELIHKLIRKLFDGTYHPETREGILTRLSKTTKISEEKLLGFYDEAIKRKGYVVGLNIKIDKATLEKQPLTRVSASDISFIKVLSEESKNDLVSRGFDETIIQKAKLENLSEAHPRMINDSDIDDTLFRQIRFQPFLCAITHMKKELDSETLKHVSKFLHAKADEMKFEWLEAFHSFYHMAGKPGLKYVYDKMTKGPQYALKNLLLKATAITSDNADKFINLLDLRIKQHHELEKYNSGEHKLTGENIIEDRLNLAGNRLSGSRIYDLLAIGTSNVRVHGILEFINFSTVRLLDNPKREHKDPKERLKQFVDLLEEITFAQAIISRISGDEVVRLGIDYEKVKDGKSTDEDMKPSTDIQIISLTHSYEIADTKRNGIQMAPFQKFILDNAGLPRHQIEVKAILSEIESAGDIKDGISHATDKFMKMDSVIKGTRGAGIVISWPERVFINDHDVHRQPNGDLIIYKTDKLTGVRTEEIKGNFFANSIPEYLNVKLEKTNGRNIHLLDEIHISSFTGDLIATYKRVVVKGIKVWKMSYFLYSKDNFVQKHLLTP